jgi:hypothetical protein
MALDEGAELLFVDRDRATPRLQAAADGYAKLLLGREKGLLGERATFGLAKANECMGKIDEARAGYEAVASDYPTGALAGMARQRVKSLEGERGRECPILEVVEHRLVEPRVAFCVALLGARPGIEDLPIVGLALELAPHRLDHPGKLGVRLPGVPVRLHHDRIDEMPAGRPRRRVDELLRATAIPPEAAGDEHEQAEPEQEAALPLQARRAEDIGKRSIRHEVIRRVVSYPKAATASRRDRRR